jgi:hypothetical protein
VDELGTLPRLAVRQFAAILVVGDEEVFSCFLEHFPAGRYSMLFAVDDGETIECLETGEAFLVVMSVNAASPKLSRALRDARSKGSVVLGLAVAGSGAMLPDLADWIVPRDNGVDLVADAARELLEERRRWPRAAIQLPLQLEFEVEMGEQLSCRATVVRIGRGDSGQRGVVFAVPDEAAPARAYLDRLVRDALRIEHELQGTVVTVPPGVERGDGGAGPTAPDMPAVQVGDAAGAAAGDAAGEVDKAESTPLVDELKGEIWLLRDEAIRHQARLAAALASAAEDRKELEKQRGEMEERMRTLEAALEREQQRVRAAAAGAPAAPASSPAPDAAHPAPAAMKPAPIQDRLQQLRNKIVKSGPHAVVAAPAGSEATAADGAGPTTPDMCAVPAAAPARPAAPRPDVAKRTVMGFALSAAPPASAPAPTTAPARTTAPSPAVGDEVDWDSTMVDAAPRFAPHRGPIAAAGAAPPAPPIVVPAAPPLAEPPAAPPVVVAPAAAPPPAPYAGYAAPPIASPPAPSPGYPAAPPYGYPASSPPPGGSPPPVALLPTADDVAVPIDVDEVPARKRPVALYVIGGVGALCVLGLVVFFGSRLLRSSPVAKGAVAVAAAPQADAAAPSTQPAEAPALVAAADATGATAALAAPTLADASAAPVAVAAADAGGGTTAAAEAAPPAAGEGAEAAGGRPDAAPATAAPPKEPAHALTAEEKRKLRQKEREALLRRGYELTERNDHQRAREALTRALKMADDPAVRDLLALSHRRSNEPWAAAHHMEKAAASSRGAARARRYVSLGALYAQLGKRADACRAYRAALSAAPGYAPAQTQLKSCPGGTQAPSPAAPGKR